jgi:DNA-binding winged helix-turn-helix (wHTH) protein
VSYTFGRFTLDCDTRQLLSEGAPIHLSPKAFDFLALLLENRRRAMSKRELLEQLWPSTFVEETNLASLIAEIRRAIHDSATKPQYLGTVYRFGYRFIGEAAERGGSIPQLFAGPRGYLEFDNRFIVLMDGVNIIGRASDATIQCEASGVSRHHARIVVSGGDVTLEDLGSKNGTFMRGQRVTSARLTDGDEFHLGKASLRFRRTLPADSAETATAR